MASTDRSPKPHLDDRRMLESLLWDLGHRCVAGVDEAGLGPLAGPVVAGAVAFEPRHQGLSVADSKTLSARKRESLAVEIRAVALSTGIGIVDREELDEMGVRQAGLEAMRRAVANMKVPPDYLLVDARTVPGMDCGQSGYIRADKHIYSVAAASILAKVERDRRMIELDERFPGYGFARHMGYGTAAHLDALGRLGVCPEHRRSFAPVRRLLKPD